MMGRSPVLGVTRDEVSGEREQTGREAYPQAAGQPVNLGQNTREDGRERGLLSYFNSQGNGVD